MSATGATVNTGKFIKVFRKFVGAIGSGAVADGSATTIPFDTDYSEIPDGTVIQFTVDRIDSPTEDATKTPAKEEVVIGIKNGASATSCVRGVEGTAQSHGAGAVVEILFTAVVWDRLIEGLEQEHDPDTGLHDRAIIADLTSSQTFTNKSLTAPTITGNGTMSGGTITTGVTVKTPQASVYKTSAQSIPNTTVTSLTFDTERYDSDTMHDNSTNPSRLTIKTAGVYEISLTGYFASNSTGIRNAYILKNGSGPYIIESKNAVNGDVTLINWTTILDLAVNDYIEAQLYQSSGVSLNFTTSDITSGLKIVRLSTSAANT